MIQNLLDQEQNFKTQWCAWMTTCVVSLVSVFVILLLVFANSINSTVYTIFQVINFVVFLISTIIVFINARNNEITINQFRETKKANEISQFIYNRFYYSNGFSYKTAIYCLVYLVIDLITNILYWTNVSGIIFLILYFVYLSITLVGLILMIATITITRVRINDLSDILLHLQENKDDNKNEQDIKNNKETKGAWVLD